MAEHRRSSGSVRRVAGDTPLESAGDGGEAVEGFETAIRQLGRAAPRNLAWDDLEHRLENFAGLASDAAARCVQAGLIDRAVELLEQGRGILLGQALDIRG
jgi:hypothetical protein